jgi:hypothetical protein
VADKRLQVAVAAARGEERQETDQRLQDGVIAARELALDFGAEEANQLVKSVEAERAVTLLMSRHVMKAKWSTMLKQERAAADQRLEEAIAAHKKRAEEDSQKAESVETGVLAKPETVEASVEVNVESIEASIPVTGAKTPKRIKRDTVEDLCGDDDFSCEVEAVPAFSALLSGVRSPSLVHPTPNAKLYQVVRTGKKTSVKEVECKLESLTHDDCFILYWAEGETIYVWEGDASSVFEKHAANTEAQRMEHGTVTATHDIDEKFWELLHGSGAINDDQATPIPKEGSAVACNVTKGADGADVVGTRRKKSRSVLPKRWSVAARAVPKLLHLSVPQDIDLYHCAGVYRLLENRLVNGFPLWKLDGGYSGDGGDSGDRWIFTSATGKAWTIGGAHEAATNFSCDSGFITNGSDHGAFTPDQISAWFFCSDEEHPPTELWIPGVDIVFTAVELSTPLTSRSEERLSTIASPSAPTNSKPIHAPSTKGVPTVFACAR